VSWTPTIKLILDGKVGIAAVPVPRGMITILSLGRLGSGAKADQPTAMSTAPAMPRNSVLADRGM